MESLRESEKDIETGKILIKLISKVLIEVSKITELSLMFIFCCGSLISRMAVYSHHQELHHVVAKEFIDSPEFESAVSGDEKYQVRFF